MISAAVHGTGNSSTVSSDYYQSAFGGSDIDSPTSVHYQRSFNVGDFSSASMQQQQQQQQLHQQQHMHRIGGIVAGSSNVNRLSATSSATSTAAGSNLLMTSSSSSGGTPLTVTSTPSAKHERDSLTDENHSIVMTPSYKQEPEMLIVGADSDTFHLMSNDRRGNSKRRDVVMTGSDGTGSSLYGGSMSQQPTPSSCSGGSSDDGSGLDSVGGGASPPYHRGHHHEGALSGADVGSLHVMGGPGETCEQTNGLHVLAPGSPAHGPGRHCLLWACKACKKKTVTVDRRKVIFRRKLLEFHFVCSFHNASFSFEIFINPKIIDAYSL